jgi:hypothetical protein
MSLGLWDPPHESISDTSELRELELEGGRPNKPDPMPEMQEMYSHFLFHLSLHPLAAPLFFASTNPLATCQASSRQPGQQAPPRWQAQAEPRGLGQAAPRWQGQAASRREVQFVLRWMMQASSLAADL